MTEPFFKKETFTKEKHEMEDKGGIWKGNVFLVILVLVFFISGCQYIKNPISSDSSQYEVKEVGNEQITNQDTQVTNQNTQVLIPSASDSGEIEFTVLDVVNKDNKEYVKIKVDKVISYSRDENAYYDEIKEGDTVELYLPFGSKEVDTKLNDATYGSVLNGLNTGDKLRGAVAGCPDKCNGGNGWALFLYKEL
ncbi:hypothetical protein J4413_01365 [Candidatus Woesearchaeota archaeon]|nr:hypothetical protein [Candidatus Woesearchaeota archaeon]